MFCVDALAPSSYGCDILSGFARSDDDEDDGRDKQSGNAEQFIAIGHVSKDHLVVPNNCIDIAQSQSLQSAMTPKMANIRHPPDVKMSHYHSVSPHSTMISSSAELKLRRMRLESMRAETKINGRINRPLDDNVDTTDLVTNEGEDGLFGGVLTELCTTTRDGGKSDEGKRDSPSLAKMVFM